MFVVIWSVGLGVSQSVMTFMPVCSDLAISEACQLCCVESFTAYDVIAFHVLWSIFRKHFHTLYYVEVFQKGSVFLFLSSLEAYLSLCIHIFM